MSKKGGSEGEKDKGGRPAMYASVEALEAAISKYFDDSTPKPITEEDEEGKLAVVCDKQGRPVYTQVFPTVAGLAHSLGYASRQSIFDLKQDERYSYVIKRALLWIESLHEQNLALRDKPVGDIFWLKNYGWTDKQEIEHSGAVQIIDDIPKIKP